MSTPLPTADEVLAVLSDVEAGRVTLTPIIDPTYGFEHAGDQAYLASNGWTIVVFIDCDEFDYVDSVVLPDGTVVDLWSHMDIPGWPKNGADNGYEAVRNYRPPAEVIRDAYQVKPA